VERNERNLYGPGIVHDCGVSHGSIDDPVVCAMVQLRPLGKELLPRERCESHDLNKHVVLLTKLVTHVITKSHMNVICLQYRSLLLCRWSGLSAPGMWCPAGSCCGPGTVAVAG
jgi:hypothetical protein